MKLKIFNYKKIKSTNDTAVRLLRDGIDNGIVSTEIQLKGKGQRGNKWISIKGNLFISIFFKINKKLSLKKLTFTNLLIIKKIISNKLNKKIYIKLPNDIFINKKKVCGILQEILYKNDLRYMIVGVGINIVNSPIIANYPTTYLNKYSKKKINKLKIIKEIKLSFENKYKGK